MQGERGNQENLKFDEFIKTVTPVNAGSESGAGTGVQKIYNDVKIPDFSVCRNDREQYFKTFAEIIHFISLLK